MAAIARGKPELCAAWREHQWELHRKCTLVPHVHAQIPLSEAARAHQFIADRRNLGKVVLVTQD